MARTPKNPLPLGDTGETVSCSLKLRGGIYRVQFPDPKEKGKYREVSTGRRTEHEAWAEAGKIVLGVYRPTIKPTAKNVTWEQVLAELPTAGTFKTRTLEMYAEAVKNLRRYLDSSGPGDVTEAKAKQWRHLFATTPFTRTKREGGKQYVRSAQTVFNGVNVLSCLWGHLSKMGFEVANPWDGVPRPHIPKKIPTAPTEEDFAHLIAWVDAKGWELMSVFVRVKSLAGCRTLDLCSVKAKQFNPANGTLTISFEQDKTHRERMIPLPPDLANRLNFIRGKLYLWERYTPETQERDSRAVSEFRPELLAMAVRRLFVQYERKFPDRTKIRPHDLRRRAITLTVKATGSVDAAAQALGVRPDTASRHYLDSTKAFDTAELMRKMAGILLPQNPAPESGT